MKVGSNIGTLKLGSTAVAAIKRGTDRVYDADVAAFQKASDAADVTGIMDLVDYLKGQSLWDYARFYPMKSSQNAGSGSTVYGLGGLTTNNMTLVNSPTWGSDGVTFDGSTQYGNVGDITDGGELYIFARVAFLSPTPSTDDALAGYYNSVTNKRGPIFSRRGDLSGDPFNLVVSSDGLNADDLRTTGHTVSTNDECLVAAFLDSGECAMYQDKEQRTLVRAGGSQQSGPPFNTDIDMFFAAYNGTTGAASLSGLLAKCPLFLSGTALTTTQREAITDLINAL